MGSIKSNERRRPLSIRRRYVARARYLKTNRDFRRDIEDQRRAWDADWLEFAIGRPKYPPESLPKSPHIWVPDKLEAAIRPAQKLLGENRLRPEEVDYVERFSEAASTWKRFVGNICDEWWPAAYYPLMGGGEFHVARFFVAGCLLWSPEHADEEWITSPILSPLPLPAPIDRLPRPEDLAELRAWGDMLMERLNSVAEAQQVLTPELLGEIWQDASAAGRAAWNACREELVRLAPMNGESPLARTTHWAVPVFPGIGWDDFNHLAADVRAKLRFYYGGYDEPELRPVARRLAQDGLCSPEIAGLLGVARQTVDNWLRGSD